MNLVRLTTPGGKAIWLNPDHIVSVRPYDGPQPRATVQEGPPPEPARTQIRLVTLDRIEVIDDIENAIRTLTAERGTR